MDRSRVLASIGVSVNDVPSLYSDFTDLAGLASQKADGVRSEDRGRNRVREQYSPPPLIRATRIFNLNTQLSLTALQLDGTCTLRWENLGYHIPAQTASIKDTAAKFIPGLHQQKGKQVISGISGFAEPGKTVIVMGASGAGKTTLLNLLANRLPADMVTGDIFVNGESIRSDEGAHYYREVCGYVYQHEVLLPYLTVRETLVYAAMLTLPNYTSFKQKMESVEILIQDLGLTKCANTIIGNALIRGISGGEKKRLAVGIELLRNPAILLLDEPTSGLDSKTALILCEHLQRIAQTHSRIIIATIHQPRATLFNTFDYLLLLSPFGSQLYFGKVSEIVGYFESLSLACPALENPADHILDCVALDYITSKYEESKERIHYLEKSWQEKEKPQQDLDLGANGLKSIVFTKRASILTQSLWLAHREVVSQSRNLKFLFVRFLQSFILPFYLSFLYFGIEDDQTGVINRRSLLFVALMAVSFNELFAAVAEFLSGSVVFYRERNGKLFHTSAYWLGKQLALLPYQLFFPFVWIMSIYWIAGLQYEWTRFFVFFAVLELVGLTTASIGMLFGALLPPNLASTISSMILIAWVCFFGFLVNLENIPRALFWISYLTYGRWAYDALVQNEFHGLTFTCDASQRSASGACPYANGQEVIDSLNISENPVWADMLILVAFCIAFRVIFYFVLRFKNGN